MGITADIPIRLEELHYIFSKQLNGDKNQGSDLRNLDIYRDLNIVSRDNFARTILPPQIYLLLEGGRSADQVLKYTDEQFKNQFSLAKIRSRRATLNRTFINKQAAVRFREVVSLLVHKNGYKYDTYKTSRYRKEIASNWAGIIKNLPEEAKKNLHTRIMELVHSIPDSNPYHVLLKNGIQRAYSDSIEDALSCMTLIACTLPIWNNTEITDLDIIAMDIILPPAEGDSPLLPSKKMLKEHADQARALLESFTHKTDHVETIQRNAEFSYKKCLEILNIKPLEDTSILGETYFILYRCCRNKTFKPLDGMNAEFYLRQSQKYKYPPAMEISVKDLNLPLYDIPPRGVSTRNGKCFLNDMNFRSQTLTETLPDNWDMELFDGRFEEESSLPVIYFLCSSDTGKNYGDLLKILDYYKRNWTADSLHDIEIFILGNEEKIENLVDTAQQYMDHRIIPIHIINEDKRSAQYLLAKHPLFYPILDYPAAKEEQYTQPLHFVIFGDDACSEYLVREAYWMMNFSEYYITPKITLIGPDAAAVIERIRNKCPGLREGISDIYPTLSAYSCEITGRQIKNYYSESLDKCISEILASPDALYFAVSLGKDEDNLSFAVTLREKLIRHYVENASERQLLQPAPIAYRCRDFNIAAMSRNMVVSVVNHGDSWYNNHKLIPFGQYADLYGWNGLIENPIEHLAQCIHLEYNGNRIPHNPKLLTAEKKQELREALDEYYKRQYNKSSSFSVALSMPYRLFNCMIHGNRILPESWSITNPSAYYNYDILDYFANKLRSLASDNMKQITYIAKWEHNRWVRWMLSEGWLPATVDEVIFYSQKGPEKHQLYIGKIHPCICEWDELKNVENELENPETKEKPDFRSYDISSAQKTEQILRGAIALHISELPEPQQEFDEPCRDIS